MVVQWYFWFIHLKILADAFLKQKGIKNVQRLVVGQTPLPQPRPRAVVRSHVLGKFWQHFLIRLILAGTFWGHIVFFTYGRPCLLGPPSANTPLAPSPSLAPLQDFYVLFPSGHFHSFHSSAPQPLFAYKFSGMSPWQRCLLSEGLCNVHQKASSYFIFNSWLSLALCDLWSSKRERDCRLLGWYFVLEGILL